jgi:poly(hydroxyalkanoate) depolymerase family esterase
MHPDFPKYMAEATRLTRSGDLQGATELIRRAIAMGHPPTPAEAHAFSACRQLSDDDFVIDVEARVVPTPDDVDIDIGTDAVVIDVPAPAPTDSGRFIAGRHGEGRAARDYKLFIPPQAAAGQPLPLVVMLHGCTQHPDDFAAGTGMNELAREQGFFVLYPAQSRRANPQGCWNWFKRSHQQRGRGEAATLARMTREVIATYGIDASRVYVAGLSAGGAMAAILGQAYPDLFAAVGVHSGLPAGAADDLPAALAAMKGQAGGASLPSAVPTIVFHGDADATVHPRNGDGVFAASAAHGGVVESEHLSTGARRAATRHRRTDAQGRVVAEHWVVHGAAHAWSGGRAAGSYTDPHGPDASAEMLRFFRRHRLVGSR